MGGTKETRIWVDAICINQAATAVQEKSYQIAIMGDIYKKATSVRVWLGEQDKSSRVACEYFAKVSGIGDGDRFPDSEHEPEKVGLDMARKWPQLSKSLVDFFARSWFNRAWPVQEVTLPDPNRVMLVCGHVHLGFDSIRLGWNVLRQLDVLPASASIDQTVALQFYLADAIAVKRGRVPAHGGKRLLTDISQFSFTSVMNAMRLKACRDPKDRFFSLFGVFKELEIDHGIPISMWALDDAKVFKAVALACFKLDGNLDAIRLAQMQDPYFRLSSNLLHARRNPYDILSSSVSAMTYRSWRATLNMQAQRGTCYTPGSEWLRDLPSWVPDWTHSISSDIDPARRITLLDTVIPPPFSPDRNQVIHYHVNGQRLNLSARILGQITEIGTVNSVKLLWQVLATTLKFQARAARTSRLGSTPDPVISAAAETCITLTLWSHMSQMLVSLWMALRTLDLFDILGYASSAYTANSYFTPRIFQLLCSRFPSVASCPTDGANMRLISAFKMQHISESHAISQAFAVFLKGRTWINRDMWRQSAGDVVFNTGGLLWYFRVSILETLLGTKYEDIDPVLIPAVMGRLISVTTQEVAMKLGDTTLYLLAWSVGVVANLGFLIAFAVWVWRYAWFLILPGLIALLASHLYQSRSPLLLLASAFRASGWFREPGSSAGYDAHGLHFFVTDTGITGSTTGPVTTEKGDCLAQIRGCASGGGYLILRPSAEKRNCYTVVGAAYARLGNDEEDTKWENICFV